MRPLAVLAATLWLASTPALAATPPGTVVEAVTAVLSEAADEQLTDPDNPPTVDYKTPPAAMFSPVDINGDGIDDWQVDYDAAPVPALWCGTGGCAREFWASQPGGGYAKVFDSQVRQATISHRNGVTVLDVDFHGTTCGGAGVDPCARRYAWNEDIGWIAVRNADDSGWLHGGPVEVNPYMNGEHHEVVERAFERLQAMCPPGGGKAERDTFAATGIPDINGDGRGDWVVGGPWTSCAGGGDALPMIVLVTAPDDAMTEAWSGTGMDFGVDIGSSPATFYVMPRETECRDGEGRLTGPCGKPLRWDAASGRLVE